VSSAASPPSARSPYTAKGLVVGCLLSVFAGAGAMYGRTLVQASWWGLNASAPGAIFLFFILIFFVNALLRTIRRPWALGRGDLVLIYAMLLMALTLSTQNFVAMVFSSITSPYYGASSENRWGELLLPHLPEWVAPYDLEAIRLFHEGLPPGQDIAWDAWIVPLTAWLAFGLALSLMMICMAVVLHRQWSTHERLAYPMVHLPQAMIEGEDEPTSRLNPFFKNRVMWLGFAIPFCFFGMDGLHEYIHVVPEFPFFLDSIYLLQDTVRIVLAFSFAWIGFFYLASLDIVFSIWFFYLLSKLQDGISNLIGVSNPEVMSVYESFQSADLSHQGTGAVIVFVCFGLWTARGHLRGVLRRAWHPAAAEAGEVFSYRLCLLGFTGSLLFLALWLWFSGVPFWALPALLGIALVYYIMITRVTTAGGVPTTRPPITPPFFVISGFGASLLGDRGLVAMGLTMSWASEMRLFPMIACANGLKLAEMVRGPQGRLILGMVLAVLCSLVAATYVLMDLAHTHGAVNLGYGQGGGTWRWLAAFSADKPEANVRGWVFTGIGGLVEGFLVWANHRWFWWPLHPIGFVVAPGFITGQIWLSAFVAWTLKSVILRQGGPGLFVKLRPFFLGLILGEATTGGLWLFIDAATGVYGNRITAM